MAAQQPDKDTVLGQLAVERGHITQAQLDEALALQQKMHDEFGMDQPLGQVLVGKHYLTPDLAQELRHAVAVQTGDARLVAGYEVVAKLGQGGFGVVYKARHRETGRFVALKILPPSLADRDHVARFEREARIVQELDHDNIVACVEFGYDPRRKVHFCALELVEGEDLGKRLERLGGRPLAEDEAVSITYQIAQALQHACFNGLVHRDVKPANIMVMPDGTAKLLDLGLARPADKEATRLTESGKIVGSPFYISPEQAKAEKEVDIRADIYALGATLYHMVTGHPPFEGGTILAVLQKHVYEQITWPAEVNPLLSDGICRIIARMMSKKPDDRYQIPNDLLNDLDKLREGGEVGIADEAIKNSSVKLRGAVRRPRAARARRERAAGERERAAPSRGERRRPDPAREHRRAAGREERGRPSGRSALPAGAKIAMGAGALGLVAVIGLVMFLGGEEPDRRPPERDDSGDTVRTQPDKVMPESVPPGAGRPTVEARKVSTPVRTAADAGRAEKPPTLTLDLGGGVTMQFVYIKPGVFTMGGTEDIDPNHAWWGIEKPKHEVAITRGFYLGKYEVTQSQYEAVTGGNPSKWKEPNRPVEQVTWHQAAEFCRLATERSRRQFRLPTEAEWEFACRAGSIGRFCFGSDETGLGEHAWYEDNSGGQTHPVGQKKPNAWGLYDMHGNVWEWVADWYAADYYVKSPRENPTGPDAGAGRLLRGGCWCDPSYRCRSALRPRGAPSRRHAHRGFRACVSSSPRGTALGATRTDSAAPESEHAPVADIHKVPPPSPEAREPAAGISSGPSVTSVAKAVDVAALLAAFDSFMRKGDYTGARKYVEAEAAKPANKPHARLLDAAARVAGILQARERAIRSAVEAKRGKETTLKIVRGGKEESHTGRVKSVDATGGIALAVDIKDRRGRVMGATRLTIRWDELAPETEDALAKEGGWKAEGADGAIARGITAIGRKDEASAARMLAEAGDHALVAHYRARMEAAQRQAAYEKAMTRARSLVKGKAWKRAVAACEEALEVKSDDPEAKKLLAEAESHIGPPPTLTLGLGGGVTMEFVYIKPGVFMMGGTEDIDPNHGWWGIEKPKHQVAITRGFYIGKYEVTQAQYQAVMGGNPSKWKEPNRPVEQVTWHKATEFCRLAAERTREQFRLPTEAEWEYACRAGSTGRYCFGNDETRLGDYAWYKRNGGGQTHPVGQKKPNAWGLYDVHGNLWEWVADWYDADYYANSPRENPTGPGGGKRRLVRGGAWSTDGVERRCAFRSRCSPSDSGYTSCHRGFRAVVSAVPRALSASQRAAYDRALSRAKMRIRLKNWKGAVEACEEALKLKPGDAEAKKLLAEAKTHLAPAPTLTLDLGGGVTMEFVYIKPGVFTMGGDEDPKHWWQGVEKPKHEVAITQGFYIGKYEVTQAQYGAVAGENPSKWKEPNRPVEMVDWRQATEFCRLATERTGKQFRLPTEAEWEFACRAGSTGRYCFGSDEKGLGDYAWFRNNSGGHTHPVGQKKPNQWGLYDVHGNLWEWVADRYAADYYANSPRENPTGPDAGDQRLLRGGSCEGGGAESRSAIRGHLAPSHRGDHGIRAVVSAVPRGQ